MKMHHRENGLANFALCPKFPKLKGFENLVEPTVEIIGDLAHVSALTLSAAIEAKKGKVSLISDAVAEPVEGLGLMDGDREAHVARNELGLLQVFALIHPHDS